MASKLTAVQVVGWLAVGVAVTVWIVLRTKKLMECELDDGKKRK